jgi:hypothetical protein
VLQVNKLSRADFSPKSVAGLTLWLDASDVSTITKDGSNLVSTWADKSGNTRNFTGAGAAKPTWTAGGLNGKDCITFDGAATYVARASAISTIVTTSAYEIFIVFEIAAASFSGSRMLLGASNDLVYCQGLAGGNICVLANYDGSADTSNRSVVADTTYVFAGRHDGGALYLSVNGGTEDTDASGNTTDVTGTINIGYRSAGPDQYFGGVIGEIAVYNSVIGTGARAALISYLKRKWGA